MAVYDRWWKNERQTGGSIKRVHSGDFGCEKRWQVRWRDEGGKQCTRSFAKKDGKNPELHAAAFDAKVKTTLSDGSYMSPKDANTTFREFAEDWRTSRTHDVETAARIERELRLHVYPVIGSRTLRELDKRPSVTQEWISGIQLAPGSALQVVKDVSQVYVAAIDDGLIARNPTRANSVTRPKPGEKKARPWTLEQVAAMSAALPARLAVLPYLGAGTGMRQGEMFGLAVDEITFLGRRPSIHVCRQVRLVGNVPCFAPLKNGKIHDVPLSDELAPVLAEHIRQYPATTVTLPWEKPGGQPVTFRLLVTTAAGRAMHRSQFNTLWWHPAQEKAGITPKRERGQKRAPARADGMHALRHTAASAWLAAGVDIVSVAAWLGDTVQVVLATYAHLMPDADERGRKAMNAFFRNASYPADAQSGTGS